MRRPLTRVVTHRNATRSPLPLAWLFFFCLSFVRTKLQLQKFLFRFVSFAALKKSSVQNRTNSPKQRNHLQNKRIISRSVPQSGGQLIIITIPVRNYPPPIRGGRRLAQERRVSCASSGGVPGGSEISSNSDERPHRVSLRIFPSFICFYEQLQRAKVNNIRFHLPLGAIRMDAFLF